MLESESCSDLTLT